LRTSRARFRNRALIALFGVTSLIAASANPAAAASGEITGENVGVGLEFTDEIIQDCVPNVPLMGTVNRSVFEVIDTGTYEGVAANASEPGGPLAVFVGQTEVEIETERYVISPEGTYIDCFIPGPVPVKAASVSTPAGQAGNVTCGNINRGYYLRRAFDKIEIGLQGACTVTGNVAPFTQTVVDDDTLHVITGVQQPCNVPVPPGGDTSVPAECVDPNDPSQTVEGGSYVVWDHSIVPEGGNLPVEETIDAVDALF